MNKTEMIEAVASETGLAKTEVAKVLNAYTDTIVKTVAEGGEYTGECLKFCVCPKFITYVALRRGGSLVERSGTSEPPLRRFRSSHHSILA